MIAFLLAALVLTTLVVALLLPPLLRRPAVFAAPVTDSADTVLREQLDELKAEQAAGNLSAAEFTEAEDELKRRILEEHRETVSTDAVVHATKPATKTAVALTLLLVLGGFALYGGWGNLLALQPERVQSAARQVEAAAAGQQMTPEQIAGMVEKLAARLEANPDDPEGWLMLARSYKMLDRPAEAAAAYAHIEALIAQDADLLVDYAETLGMSAATRLAGKPRQLLTQALQLDPDNRRALFLAGVAALDAGDNAEAVTYWEKLLPQVAPGSELHNLLTEQLAKIKGAK
ncbi:hypothetical protein AGMMS50289_06380 [Betaproteobacteria bacterium]|nr:hypothetical protein AGMMS50289_06380 [Betaproteobacteria bacterium]